MSNEVKELGEVLDELSGKVPQLISRLLGTLYSAEAGTQMGQSVGSFYKELIAAGIPSDDALKMARDYMLSIKNIISSASATCNPEKKE
ncbi:MAG: hypothetical protein VB111_00100 [Clostridiaceae bacterium]|nr:hypothetical protein [Clostridiaceae bacterium]